MSSSLNRRRKRNNQHPQLLNPFNSRENRSEFHRVSGISEEVKEEVMQEMEEEKEYVVPKNFPADRQANLRNS